ncbi:hypothetical protein TWF481_006580 [Arthrobotrys musiformis]|uniref:F-box domain-containing protein n=1 Tax=Arthrobotrys musiformis TaxID=47236 RepID=A0AAV9WAX6_9PEZI
MTPNRRRLLDLPVEVIQRIFPHLLASDLRNLACCNSTMFKVVIPILYRSLCVYFAERRDYIISPSSLETIMDIPASTISRFKKFYVLRLGYPEPRSLRGCVSDMDDMLLRLVIKRFEDGQLRKIKLENHISSRTLAIILERQRNLNALEINDLGALRELYDPHQLAPSFFTQPLRLTYFAVGEILQTAGLIALQIIHQNASTLRTLKLGDIQHNTTTRLPTWEDTSENFGPQSEYFRAWDRPSPESKFGFHEIILPSLERLYIFHGRQFAKFIRFLGQLISGCRRLETVRVSSPGDPYRFIRRLVETGSENIGSLQLSQCDSSNSQTPLGSELQTTSTWVSSLHTLQIATGTHSYSNHTFLIPVPPQNLKRFWLSCVPADCDPTECEALSKLFDYQDSQNHISLIQNNWPLLEELAIPHPGWAEVPLLPFIRVLRLLDWNSNNFGRRPERNLGCIPKIGEYIARLDQYSNSTYNRPPELRLIVVDERYNEGSCDHDMAALGYPLCFGVEAGKIRMLRSRMDALGWCRKAGCSSYLTLGGLPTPEGAWGDDDQDYIFGEADVNNINMMHI